MNKKEIKIEKIVNLHNFGLSPIEISQKLDCSISNVSKRLRKIGIKPIRCEKNRSRKNRYCINEEYFDKINTEEKSYTLGLLYADGSVSKDGFYLKMKDEEILLKIKQKLDAEQSVKYLNYNGNSSYLLSVCSQKMYKSLVKQGCFINKTYILEFPTEQQVPKELIPHFIRGYFDGDGCININIENSQSRIDFTSASTNFLESLRKILSNISGVKGSLLKEVGKSNTWHLRYSGNRMNTILNWLYKDATIFMKRKHDKFLIYKNVQLKQGELLENPTTVIVNEDNQQPSLSSNTFEGSTTNSQVQKDSNADTSALPKLWMSYEEWKSSKEIKII